MKIKIPTSKKVSSINFLTRFPPLWGGLGWGKIKSPISKKVSSINFLYQFPSLCLSADRFAGLGWGFLFLLTTAVQAQKIQEPNLPRITDSLKTIFYKNAKRAALTDEKTNELVKIIDERNKVIADYDAKRKRYNAPYSIQDPGVFYTYKIDQAQKYYAKKIKDLITYEQYGHFTAVNFREEAEEKTKEEFEQLLESNPSLTQEQKEKLQKLIYGYHLNLSMTTAYYNFDKTLQKAKQGAMTFGFEKKFAETCKELNIKMDKMNKSSANNFQWN